MKINIFEDKNDLITYLLDTFADKDDISIAADRNVANIFAGEYGDYKEFDSYSVYISSEIDEYYISKVNDEFFAIEAAKTMDGKRYKVLSCPTVIILRDLYNEKLADAIECPSEETIIVEDGCEDECCCCECCEDESGIELDDAKEEFISTICSQYNIDRDIVIEIFNAGYVDGIKSTCLSLSQQLGVLAE